MPTRDRDDPMLTQHARIRHLAAKVLLVWLLALATGIVNACVVAPMTTHGPDPMAGTSAIHPAQSGSHAGCAYSSDDDTEGLGQASCAKFCVDESNSVPAAKHAFDPCLGLDVAVVPTMALAVVAQPSSAAQARSSAPPPLARVPVPIAFLRLTI